MAGAVAGLDELLSEEGWPYASQLPVAVDDPGRYHALFGRDSAITALQVLPARPDVARATLRALAGLQATQEDPETDAEPGKIVHEWWPRAPDRLRETGWPVRGEELRYYGSADSTSWFLVLLASLEDAELAAELEEAWRAAGAWLEGALRRGGGLVRHGPRRGRGGLAQQGWRDAEDPTDPGNHGAGILRPDGEPPRLPLADADTQAVAVVALRALRTLSGDAGWALAAERLSAAIEASFGPETVAVDADGEPVGAAGSQVGWLLWAEALPADARDGFEARLCRPDVLTSSGVRTLSSEHPLFRPDAYHRGSIWPFDSWLAWGGLRRSRPQTAEQLRRGILEALDTIGQAPELYAVGPEGPRRIPVANRVQAWTVGARWALENGWDGRAEALFGRPRPREQTVSRLR